MKKAIRFPVCLMMGVLLTGMFLPGAPSAKASDGKLEINNEVITQKNKESRGSAKAPKKIMDLMLSSRQKKVEAIRRRERERLERARASQFLAREVKKSGRAREAGALLAGSKQDDGGLPKNIGNFERTPTMALPPWLVYIPVVFSLAAMTAAGVFLGKKYARIFKVKK